MVENQLGLLFGQIAESIRSGLGDIGKLKPNAFPAKIDDIVALIGTGGGGSGGGESGSSGALTFASGSFPLIEDGQRVTIEHGLGVMPDLILVQVVNYLNFTNYEEAAQTQAMMAAWGMRSTFGTGNHSGYTSTVWGLNTTYGIDNMPEKEQTYGYIFCPDEATFQVGSTIEVGKLYSKTGYRWLAVSGMGGGTVDPGESEEMIYYRSLAESLMTRDAKYMGDNAKMELKGFKTSTGNTLASLSEYSFAGFDEVEGMAFTDVMVVYKNAFYGCEALRIIDITVTEKYPNLTFMSGSLNACPNIEAIIVRQSGNGVSNASIVKTHGSNDNFYVYVPSADYDTIVAALSGNTITAERYRKLEDYPQVDKWNESNI